MKDTDQNFSLLSIDFALKELLMRVLLKITPFLELDRPQVSQRAIAIVEVDDYCGLEVVRSSLEDIFLSILHFYIAPSMALSLSPPEEKSWSNLTLSQLAKGT